jgi:hypothetical protein
MKISAKKRLLIKTYMEILLHECERREAEEAKARGRTQAQLVDDIAKDVAGWSVDDKAHARSRILRKAGLVKDSGGKPN